MEGGALNEARRMITPRSREVIEEGKGIPVSSTRCSNPTCCSQLGKRAKDTNDVEIGGGEWDL